MHLIIEEILQQFPRFWRVLGLACLCFCSIVRGQDWNGPVITDPGLTSRCEELTDKRNKKVAMKQRLSALLVRNERLQRVTPPNKASIKDRLVTHHRRLERELDLVKMKVTTMEEDIIRKGCPGIAL